MCKCQLDYYLNLSIERGGLLAIKHSVPPIHIILHIRIRLRLLLPTTSILLLQMHLFLAVEHILVVIYVQGAIGTFVVTGKTFNVKNATKRTP